MELTDKEMKFFRKFEFNWFVLCGERKPGAVRTLEERGLLEVKRDQRFGVVATLTDSGHELHAMMNP